MICEELIVFFVCELFCLFWLVVIDGVCYLIGWLELLMVMMIFVVVGVLEDWRVWGVYFVIEWFFVVDLFYVICLEELVNDECF